MDFASTTEQLLQELVEQHVSKALRDFDERLMLLEAKTGLVDVRQCMEEALQEGESAVWEQRFPDVPDEPGAPDEANETKVSDSGNPHDPSLPEGSHATTLWERKSAGPLGYKLQSSVWELSLLVGLGVLSFQESLLIVICGFASCLIEVGFVVILFTNRNVSQFTADLASEMKEWRVIFGHNEKFRNSITGESLVAGICGFSQSLMDGQAQAKIYASIYKYGIRPDGVTEGLWPLLPVGGWLSVIALLVWASSIVKELVSIIGFGCAVWAVPRQRRSMLNVTDDGGLCLPAITSMRALAVSLLITVPRLLITMPLAITGARFLATSTSLSSITIDVLAMEVVLNIHSIFVDLFMLERTKLTVESLRPLPQGRLVTWMQDLKPILAATMIIGAVIVSHFMFLKPNLDSMQMTANALCAGDTDFVFFKEASGLVYVTHDLYAKKASDQQADAYEYRAVLKATQLQHVSSHSLSVDVPKDLLEGTMDLIGLSMKHRNELWPFCSDHDSDFMKRLDINIDTATVALLQELTQDSSIQSCSMLQHHCYNMSRGVFLAWQFRSLCPETCGCSTVDGSPIPNSPDYGCPQMCKERYDVSLSNLSCEDSGVETLLYSTYMTFILTRFEFAHLGYIREQGCEVFRSDIIDRMGTVVNFCADHAKLYKFGIQSARTICPVTCGCKEHFKAAAQADAVHNRSIVHTDIFWGLPVECSQALAMTWSLFL